MTNNAFQAVYRLIGLVLILSFFACDNGSSSSSSSTDIPEDSGNLSFSIEWQDEPENSSTTSRGAVDCAARNLETIEVLLMDSANKVIASGKWNCDEHGGTLENIPAPLSEVTLLLMGKNKDHKIIYRGTKEGLSITSGTANNAGAVSVFRFVPPTVEMMSDNSFKWASVPGAIRYRVAICAKNDFIDLDIDDPNVETSSYAATGLTPGQSYFVKIYAIDTFDNESRGSEVASLTALSLAPIPLNVSASDDLMMINLTWEGDPQGRYNLYWSTNPAVTKDAHEGKVEDIEGLSYVHENLQENTLYYYVVTAENSVGQESEISAEVFATSVGTPVGPENVSATAGEREVALSWTAAPGFVYNIYWSTQAGVSKSEHEEKIAGIDGDSFVHEGCASMTHYYIVTAENEFGEGEPSDEVSASPGWIELLTDELNGLDEGSEDVVVDAEGNTFVLGFFIRQFEEVKTNGGRDLLVAKYDPQGVRQWVKTVGTDLDDSANSIGMDAAGNLYVSGTTEGDWGDYFPNPTGGYRYSFILKLNPEGELQRIMTYRPECHDLHLYNHLAVNADGEVYLTGTFETIIDPEWFLTENDFFTVKYNTEGDQEWIKIFDESDHDVSHSITLDGQGGAYVAGGTSGEVLVLKYTAAGEEEWRTLHGNADNNIGYSIDVDGDVCYVSGTWATYKLHISRFNPVDGAHLWTEVIDGVGNHSRNAISITANGDVVFAGHTDLTVFDDHEIVGGSDGLLMAYNAEGERLWSRLFGTSEDEVCAGIVVDEDAYAHIAGYTGGDLGGQSNSGGFEIFNWKLYVGP